MLPSEVVLALEKVWPEAACWTCCFEGIMEIPNFAKKFMPRRGVATAASKKSNSKFWRKPQAGIGDHLSLSTCTEHDKLSFRSIYCTIMYCTVLRIAVAK